MGPDVQAAQDLGSLVSLHSASGFAIGAGDNCLDADLAFTPLNLSKSFIGRLDDQFEIIGFLFETDDGSVDAILSWSQVSPSLDRTSHDRAALQRDKALPAIRQSSRLAGIGSKVSCRIGPLLGDRRGSLGT